MILCATIVLLLRCIGKMRFMAAWVYLVLVLLCVLTSLGFATCQHPTSSVEDRALPRAFF
eukprot:7076668-Karenia_brevis.AAC.1